MDGSGNDFVGTVDAVGDTVEIVDINDLVAGTITAVNDVRLEAGSGAAVGNLDLTGDITLTGAAPTQILLQADNGIDQTDLTQISATQLFLSGVGDFNLNTTTFNDVSVLLADIDGSLTFSGGLDLSIGGTTTYTSVCTAAVELCGVNVDQNGGLDGDLNDQSR